MGCQTQTASLRQSAVGGPPESFGRLIISLDAPGTHKPGVPEFKIHAYKSVVYAQS